MISHRVRIKDSAYGKGLFAHDKTLPFGGPRNRRIVFRNGDVIVDYNGEPVSQAELDRRYDRNGTEYSAPYGIINYLTDQRYDGACRRGVGNLANHGRGHNKNADLTSLANGQVVLTATKNIVNGDEIIVDYGADYNLNEPTRHTTSAAPRTRRRRHYYNPPPP
jgi:hypothetical protein